ncbi:MAG: topoisomerase-4 subunit A [Saprospiraceae bacterium]|jgi:topoisomerase-4 subunit A
MSEDNHDQEDNELETNTDGQVPTDELGETKLISGFYQDWFLDYASYVILERAVPHINDGLKPVQRRILHSMKELEDGRYNKVANIVGNTMKYHPHGDMSIADALVHVGQKDLLIDMQGNWGNVLTGDRAAASRYIEARLTKFALEVIFNPKTTKWRDSYDGRNKEPDTLPVKFPLLLAQGVEGIAVGLACKILPHNFNELIDASVARLRGRNVIFYPDFHTGGMIDVSNYNDGLRGGKIRCRARIVKQDKKTLIITEIPFGCTTGSVIDSILRANEKGKIKIKKVEDNTSSEVEIIVHLAPNISPDKMVDALYAFTDCEVSISPNSGIIEDETPKFVGVSKILKQATENTQKLLTLELEIRLGELNESWHFNSLEKIFIENRIYRDIEECETWEAVIEAIDKGLSPFKKTFFRDVTRDDIIRLTEIKIKRISKFDKFKADEAIQKIEDEIKVVKNHLKNIVDYTVDYYKNLKNKYGKGKERKTEIRVFENIVASKVVVANRKLYVNREEGFVGFGLKKDEFISDCSDIDSVIVFTKEGNMTISKVSTKAFFGKDIVHVGVWKKGDKRTIYNAIYQDGKKGAVMIKRFNVVSITRDKEYPITKGSPGSKLLYFTMNPNGEAEIVNVQLKPVPGIRKYMFDFDFKKMAIKGRASVGNILSKYPVKKITLKEEGVSTLAPRKIWFDDTVRRLNIDKRGQFLGEFKAGDKILCVNQSGNYKLSNYSLSNHFEEDMILLEKFNPKKPISTVYWDGDKKQFNVKRFLIEETDRKVLFITEHENSYLELVSSDWKPVIEVIYSKVKGKERAPEKHELEDLITVKGIKALGNRLTKDKVKMINMLDSIPFEEPIEEGVNNQEDKEDSDEKQGSLGFE